MSHHPRRRRRNAPAANVAAQRPMTVVADVPIAARGELPAEQQSPPRVDSEQGLVILDAEGRVVSVSAVACALTGYTPRETAGRTLPGLFGMGDEAAGAMARALERAAAVGWVKASGMRRRKDGSSFLASVLLTAMRTGSGSLVGFLVSLTNLTAGDQSRDREARAAQAVVEVMQIKSDFLANISHELRTPLNAVMGYSDMVLDTELTEEQREALLRIRSAGETMHGLILNLLDSAKVERGAMEVELTPFSIRALLQEVLAAAALRAHSKRLELCCNVRPDVPDDVCGSPSRLAQVLEQLLDNATKFTPAGEIVVSVKLERTVASEAVLHFTVEDTGIGIPPDKLGQVFEPFVQVDGSMRRRYGGAGLGLTVARQLVEHMGGEIWIESESGHTLGTSVHVVLGFHDPQPLRASAPAGHGEHVLVADDNATARAIVAEIVERCGMIPHPLALADEVVAALRSGTVDGRPLDLAIVDANLTLADGSTIATATRDTTSRAPIVLMTSPRHPGDMLRFQNLDVAGYLAKPIFERVLSRVLVETTRTRRPETRQAADKVGAARPHRNEGI